MPNWCDNQLEILAKEETIQWVAKHLNENVGRRCEEPYTSLEFAFVYGDELWYRLIISVRTAGSGFHDFLTMIGDKFRNIHIKGHYYIELMGGGDYEEGTDEEGKKYSFFWELPANEYEYDDEYLYEFPTEDELLWDQERTNDLDMWYYITGSTNPNERDDIECDLWDMYHWSRIWWSEHNDGNGIPAPSGMGYMYMIDFNGKWIPESFEFPDNTMLPREEELNYNVYEELEKENQDEIDQLLPYELYGVNEKCMYSAYHGVFHNNEDDELFTYDEWFQSEIDLDEMMKEMSEEQKILEENEELLQENKDVLEDEGYYEERHHYQGILNPSLYASWPDILMTHDVYLDIEQEERYEVPEEEELMMDDVRKDNFLYERALYLGWKPLNYGDWEEIEWCVHYWECTEEKQKEFDEEFPTEEELRHNVYEELEKEEQNDIPVQ